MKYKICVFLICFITFIVVKFNVSYSLKNKNIVWQRFSDVCYYDKNRIQQRGCAQARCHQIPNILVEKRFFENENMHCMVVSENRSIYNISIDDEYKKHNFHMPVALGPTIGESSLVNIKINRDLFDPNHLLDLNANITLLNGATNYSRYSFEFSVESTFIENSLIELFYNMTITCDDILESMVNNQYLTLKSWTMLKILFHTKRQTEISHSFTIAYEMANNETCHVPINIKTLEKSNIAEMIIYQGPRLESFSHPLRTQNVVLNSPFSIKLNGSEACNPFYAGTPDPIKDNQPNINPLKFYDKCRKLNNVRAEPEPAYCENLPEVNVRSLILNGETIFWCVTIDKNFAPSKYENDSSPMMIQIDMGLPTSFVRWYNASNAMTTNTTTIFVFEVQQQIVISIEPIRSTAPVNNIKSLKVNGLESCGLLLENSVCGVRKIKHRPFIAYGLPTYPGQYPWHVAIYKIIVNNERQYLCGGSVIGANAVLTAAHCVFRNNRPLRPDVLAIEVGRFDLQYASKYTREYEVIKVLPHAAYNNEYFENDIAILKTKLYIEFNDFVQPICLTSNAEPFENGLGYVPGWGKNELNERENVLAEASVPIIDSSVCRASNRDFFQTFLLDGKFCGGYRNGTAVCTGDSGGGLVVEFPTRWYIKGIVSIGISENGLCDVNQYVLFTDIVYYNDWIKSNLVN